MVIIILTIDGYKNLNAYKHTFKSELYKDSTRVVWNLKIYDFRTRSTYCEFGNFMLSDAQKSKPK